MFQLGSNFILVVRNSSRKFLNDYKLNSKNLGKDATKAFSIKTPAIGDGHSWQAHEKLEEMLIGYVEGKKRYDPVDSRNEVRKEHKELY